MSIDSRLAETSKLGMLRGAGATTPSADLALMSNCGSASHRGDSSTSDGGSGLKNTDLDFVSSSLILSAISRHSNKVIGVNWAEKSTGESRKYCTTFSAE